MDFVGKVEFGSFEIRALCFIFFFFPFLVRYILLQEIYVVSDSIPPLFYFIKQQ